MKSLFSCIPRKKNKLKKSKDQISEDKIISDSKPVEVNNLNVEPNFETNITIATNQENHNVEDLEKIYKENNLPIEVCQKIKITENEDFNKEEYEKQLLIRLNNACLRIENVQNLLSNKYSGYCLSVVISLFYDLYKEEVFNYQLECENLGELLFQKQSELVGELFKYHNSLLSMIKSRNFNDLQLCLNNFRSCVVNINELCIKDASFSELHRIIADSIIIFAWICVLERPSIFVQHNLDGIQISIARLINNDRFIKCIGWLKSWNCVLKKFSLIVTINFQASLMWGIDGSVPMDILKCLIECNYSAIINNTEKIRNKSKDVVIKTTTAEKMSCETMTNLMDDLRSGRQKSKLRAIKKEVEEIETPLSIVEADLLNDELISEVYNDTIEPMKIIDYDKEKNMWIIENAKDVSDIEVNIKAPNCTVLIRNCENCSIQIDDAVKIVTLEHCLSMNLVVETITDLCEISDCSVIESQVFGKITKTNLKSVQSFKLFIPMLSLNELEITSFKSSDIELFVSKSEGDGLELDDYEKYTVTTNCRSKFADNKMTRTLF